MDEAEQALELGARKKIFSTIDSSPGLHFRELQRRTGIAVGSLQYHLDFLEKKHLIRVVKDGKFSRYFSIRGKQLGESQNTMSLLRKEKVRKIILFLLEKKKANQLSIANAAGLSTSTTSWHLSQLMEKGLLSRELSGRETFFSVKEPEKVAGLIVSHRKSFLDELVDSFVEIWEEI